MSFRISKEENNVHFLARSLAPSDWLFLLNLLTLKVYTMHARGLKSLHIENTVRRTEYWTAAGLAARKCLSQILREIEDAWEWDTYSAKQI